MTRRLYILIFTLIALLGASVPMATAQAGSKGEDFRKVRNEFRAVRSVQSSRPQYFPFQSQFINNERQPSIALAAAKVTASQAKSIALNYVRGSEFLDIKLVGGKTYRVRVIRDGQRIDVYVDANTGQVH